MIASLLLYLATHWVIVIAVCLAVIGLGIASYVLKNLHYAIIAAALATAGFLYQGAVMSGIQDQLNKDAAAQSETYKSHLREIGVLSLKDAAQSKLDADKIDKLESKASETPKNVGACFDVDTARRVSNIGKSKPASYRAGGYSKLFSKGSR